VDYFTYILKCSDNSFYTGIAIDLKKRVSQHNGEIKGGAIYTRSRRPVELKYFEKYQTRSQALKREAEVKKLTHDQKSLLK
jgi:putative endonuclease